MRRRADVRRRARVVSLTNTVNVATNAPESPRKLGLNTFGANGAARTANAIDATFTKSVAAAFSNPRKRPSTSFPRRDDSNRDDAARDGGDRTVDVERAREESVELPASEDVQGTKSDEVVEAEDWRKSIRRRWRRRRWILNTAGAPRTRRVRRRATWRSERGTRARVGVWGRAS